MVLTSVLSTRKQVRLLGASRLQTIVALQFLAVLLVIAAVSTYFFHGASRI
ncbi:hypothetical protein [Natrinema gelatinilyticum]|uniref:hypothetical protein n=1 Tax=Natrinema gelatinilyticum TaxID=2961571 RepID=UPI0020C395FF|nr:hypothetical protein [Natrinema gelatinilyticum]